MAKNACSRHRQRRANSCGQAAANAADISVSRYLLALHHGVSPRRSREKSDVIAALIAAEHQLEILAREIADGKSAIEAVELQARLLDIERSFRREALSAKSMRKEKHPSNLDSTSLTIRATEVSGFSRQTFDGTPATSDNVLSLLSGTYEGMSGGPVLFSGKVVGAIVRGPNDDDRTIPFLAVRSEFVNALIATL